MRILVAVDGSDNALRALDHAIALLNRISESDNCIDLISVHDPAALRYASGVIGEDRIEDYLSAASDDDLREAKSRLAETDLQSTCLVEHGPIAQTIGAKARDGSYDLLVLGTKGRGSFKDFILGSVAQRLSGLTEVPILLVR